jgi:hypothetical protein
MSRAILADVKYPRQIPVIFWASAAMESNKKETRVAIALIGQI